MPSEVASDPDQIEHFHCADWLAALLMYTNWAVKSLRRTQPVITMMYSWCRILWSLSHIFSNLFWSHYYGWHERSWGAASGCEVWQGNEDFGHHTTRWQALLALLEILSFCFNIQKERTAMRKFTLTRIQHMMRIKRQDLTLAPQMCPVGTAELNLTIHVHVHACVWGAACDYHCVPLWGYLSSIRVNCN